MDIPSKIDAILAERKKLLPKINEVLARVRKAGEVVGRLDAYRSAQNELPPELMEQLAAISTKPFYEKQEAAVQQLEQLQKRFSRDEINISFVGRARQGKSLVLQRISGLGGDIIPSSDGSHCTGTRSIISNSPNTETMAEIDFYTEAEFVGIVNAYLKEIFRADAHLVSSAAGIRSLNMAQLRSQAPYDQITLIELLEKYVEHVGEFQGRFGSHITIPGNEIESYVAQYSSKDHNVKYFTYLGVKQANIHASFPCAQCGRIVLVDTIGTGATALGVEDEMIATVLDSDAIILMMRPDPMADIIFSDYYELVMSIAHAVTPEYTKQMLFWLFNRVETGNGANASRIPAVMGQLKKQSLPVAQYLNVDCSAQMDVENGLLIPVLEQMSANLSGIDSMILKRANERLIELEQTYHTISARIERALSASINQDERREFRQRIETTVAFMTNQLRDLYLNRDKEKGLPCTVLKEAAAVKLKHVVCSVPSHDTIMQWLNDGRINQFNALELLSDQLRLQIINDFMELNEALHKIVQDMKRDVVHVLASEDIGRLGFTVGTDPGGDPGLWLKSLRSKLDETQFPLLRNALMPLEDFDLKMENFLIYKVRCCLKPIDWSINVQPPQLKNGLDRKEQLADEIESHLRDFLEDVHQGISDELADFYSFPNTALFAVLRDFYDRAVCAQDSSGKSVKTEWQYLYEDKIPMVWSEEHNTYAAIAGRAEEWRILTEDIHSCAADGYFLIDMGGHCL